MACVAPKGRAAPSCRGYEIGDEAESSMKVLCPFCKKLRNQAKISVNLAKQRELSRVQGVKKLSKNRELTGSSLQKQVTALAEQVLIDLFEDCARGENPPADFALMACGSVARREMVTFSDIDAILVLSNNEPKTLSYFESLTLRMNHRLQTVATRVTMEDNVPMVGNSGFVFCPGGGLSPANYFNTAQTLVDDISLAAVGDAHIRGALFTRLVYGSEIWARNYNDLCEKALKSGAGNAKLAAVQALGALVARRPTDLKQAKKDDTVINLKTTIYRVTQLVPNEIAIYYGVNAMGTREQIVKLVQGGNMSLQVANIFMETLESYAKVMTAVQLKAGQEQHTVRTIDLPTSNEFHKAIKLNPEQLLSIKGCLPRVELIWKLTEEFHYQKSKRGPFASKKNPFKSTTPWQDMGVSQA